MRILRILLVTSFCAVIPACNNKSISGPKTVPVSGIVTFKGSPIADVVVTFYPADETPGAGRTDAQGRFTLGTNKQGDGAVAGRHRITVVYVGPEQPSDVGNERPDMPVPKSPISLKYANPETSGLTEEIPDGGKSDVRINLT